MFLVLQSTQGTFFDGTTKNSSSDCQILETVPSPPGTTWRKIFTPEKDIKKPKKFRIRCYFNKKKGGSKSCSAISSEGFCKQISKVVTSNVEIRKYLDPINIKLVITAILGQFFIQTGSIRMKFNFGQKHLICHFPIQKSQLLHQPSAPYGPNFTTKVRIYISKIP